MRIIGKFHDYYDGVQSYNQDGNTVHWVRKTEVIKLTNQEIKSKILGTKETPLMSPLFDGSVFSSDEIETKKTEYAFSSSAIAFCGKVYPYIKVETTKKSAFIKPEPDVVKFFYDVKEYFKFLDEKSLAEDTPKYRRIYYSSINFLDKKDIEIFFDCQPFKNHTEIFFEYNTPIYTVAKEGKLGIEGIEINSCLKDIQFYKVFDPFQTFQEIEMFLTGVLPNNKKISVLSDKDKIQKHGYDKWSFRKKGEK